MSDHFQLQSVSLSFGAVQALSDVTLNIEPGEQIAFIGPSGSGKTTLLRLLGSQIHPGNGSCHIFDCDPRQLPPRELRELRSRIAYVPQQLGLVPNLRVLQNVLNGRIGQRSLASTLRSLTFPRKDETEDAYSLLERVGISEKIYDRTDSLSGGQQQRVAIARALFQKADAMITDEPVSALDPTRARNTIDRLCSLSREDGFTLLTSIHSLELARDFFPRLIGLRGGKVIFDSSPDELPADAYTSLFAV